MKNKEESKFSAKVISFLKKVNVRVYYVTILKLNDSGKQIYDYE